MSFIQDLIAAQNDPLFENHIEPPARTETQAIVADTYDKMTWDVLQATAPSLNAMGERMEAEYHTGRAVEEDVFNLLFQSTPQVRDAQIMQPDYAHSPGILTEIAETEEVQALRKRTQLDEYQTAFAMLELEPELQQAMVRLKEIREREEQAAQNLANAAAGGDPNAIAEALAAAQAADQANQLAQMEVTADLQAAAGQTAQDIDDHNKAMASYGLGEGELKRMDFENRRLLSKRLHAGKLKRLASMIGQFKAYGRGERRKRAKHAKSEVYDYELSNDLTRLVPEELNNLAVPELEDIFWVRWQQHALLTKKERGPQRVGKGPIIVVCDESGSMAAIIGDKREKDPRTGEDISPTREMWSKAVTFALSEQAKMEKRDFTYIGFSGGSSIYQRDFKGGNVTLDGIAELVEHFYNGGTNYVPALNRARGIIRDSIKADREQADIVFITDGNSAVDDDWLTDWQQFCKNNDVHTYGIKVGADFNTGGTLERIATKTLTITALNANPEGVQELFAQI